MSDEKIEDTIRRALSEARQARAGKGRQKGYEYLKLPYNPFPVASISSPELVASLPPLDKTHRDVIKTFLETSIKHERYSGLRVVGGYGFGKTHILRWLEFQVKKIGEGYLEALYVSNPGSNVNNLLSSIIKAIGRTALKKKIWFIVLREFRNRLEAHGSKFLARFQNRQRSLAKYSFGPEEAEVFSDEVISNHRKFLELVRERGYNETAIADFAQKALARFIDNETAVRAFVSLITEEEGEALKSWSQLVSGRTRIPSAPEDFFKSILSILNENGIIHTFLLIDEFEDISVRMTSRSRIEYVVTLRTLVDKNLRDFSLVVAMTTTADSLFRQLYPAGYDRLNFSIELRPLTTQQTQDLVRAYLDMARSDTEFEQYLGTLEPFSKDSIEPLTKRTEGNPRAIVARCHELVEYCRLKRVNLIDLEMVRRMVRRGGPDTAKQDLP